MRYLSNCIVNLILFPKPVNVRKSTLDQTRRVKLDAPVDHGVILFSRSLRTSIFIDLGD